MASNGYPGHFSQSPPSPSFKTYPTRRRIIRKSPRSSIKLSTLKKNSTFPQNEPFISDSSDSSPHFLRKNKIGRNFGGLDLVPNKGQVTKRSLKNYGNEFRQSSSSKSLDFPEYSISGNDLGRFRSSGSSLKTTSKDIPSGLEDSGGSFESLLRLFSCSGCGGLLRQPVTLECGHTCCKGCAPDKCPMCGVQVDRVQCINVLVRSIVNKLVGDRIQEKDCVADETTLPKKSKFFHPYNLRYRRGKHKKVRSEEKLKDQFDESISNHSTSSSNTINKLSISNNSEIVLGQSELECVLCCRWLSIPVTTRCGHTFCRSCLERVLDHGLGCPLCMGRLSPGYHHTRPTTHILAECVRRLCPDYEQLEDGQPEKDTQVPVFICTSAFPGVACPLYVYEPRYRLLTRRCLQSGEKRFAMAAAAPGPGIQPFAPYGTLLEVRDAVHLRDGRSILTTVGIRRFRVLSRDEKDGYDTATVEYIRDVPIPAYQLSAIRALHERVHRKAVRWVNSLGRDVLAEVEQSLGAMPPLESSWITLPDGPSWAWWIMPILPLSTQLQVGFLSTTSLEKRLRAIDKLLDRMSVRMRALKRSDMRASTQTDDENVADTCSSSSQVHHQSSTELSL